MSNQSLARRTAVEVAFDGTDISSSIRGYLLSLTYTDNEEDEADDLQIKLQDRDSVWLEYWLEQAIQAAAGQVPGQAGGKSYKVTAKSGLNVRAGPGTRHKKLGALSSGTVVEVSAIESGWASILYNGQKAYASAAYLKATKEPASGSVTTALKIQAAILRENWNSDGKDKLLDCGEFELDSVSADGPPATVTIKATSLPYSAKVRQTLNSKAWEACKLSGIANEIAGRNGMLCMFESGNDPFYERIEQIKTSDIEFLSQLCHDAGISLKATNSILVLFNQAAYEDKAPILTIKRGVRGYTRWKLGASTADTQYTSCRVSYVDPATGKCIAGIAKVEDYDADAEDNQQLEISAKVSSVGEAKTLAEKHLRLHNKYAKTASFTLPGDPDLVAGVTVTLEDWGAWDGKYIVSQAKHTVSNTGYTVQVQLRKVLEGY